LHVAIQVYIVTYMTSTNTTRIHHLSHLAEMMGSETTDTEAELMAEALIDAGVLDAIPGTLADIDEDRWLEIMKATLNLRLLDETTGEAVGTATPEQIAASLATDTGVILIDTQDGDVLIPGTFWAQYCADNKRVRRVYVA
jgi:hypothetical protein